MNANSMKFGPEARVANGTGDSHEPLRSWPIAVSEASQLPNPTGNAQPKIAVIIPCYRCRDQILGVLMKIGNEVARVFVVDDACPQHTGEYVKNECKDPRVTVVQHEKNQGVGGAMVTGYQAALAEGMDVMVKVDGDGQMDPELVPDLIAPILSGEADYTKGNRFFRLEGLKQMPVIRKLGNAALSFTNKAVSGYWDIMDPTNGFVAVHAKALALLPLRKIERRFFFESDMLFRLNLVRAVVMDVPMDALYSDERSNLRIRKVLFEFPPKYGSRLIKRLFYTYCLRDFNLCSLQILAGTPLLLAGLIFGGIRWYVNSSRGVFTPTGTILLATVQVVLGFQLLLAAASFDVQNVPRRCLHQLLHVRRRRSS
jgi:glycosyltransferase involved in cell wall biosynthesis